MLQDADGSVAVVSAIEFCVYDLPVHVVLLQLLKDNWSYSYSR